MKDQILLSELQNYLAYGLKLYSTHYEPEVVELLGIDLVNLIHVGTLEKDYQTSSDFLKPLVRPLSELPERLGIAEVLDGSCSFAFMQFCCKNHFDVFNWLERGLAISLTDFEKEKAL